MLNFNDSEEFVLIHQFKIPMIYTWGEKHPEKREEIRRNALKGFPVKLPMCAWYAFYIKIERSSFDRPLDI